MHRKGPLGGNNGNTEVGIDQIALPACHKDRLILIVPDVRTAHSFATSPCHMPPEVCAIVLLVAPIGFRHRAIVAGDVRCDASVLSDRELA